MANYTTSLKVTEWQRFDIAPKDAAGNVASLDAGTLSVGSSDVTILKVVNRGGFAPTVLFMEPVKAGSATVTISATSSGAQLTETIDVTVLPVIATTFGVVFQTPVPK
jgi:hypothetical protein